MHEYVGAGGVSEPSHTRASKAAGLDAVNLLMWSVLVFVHMCTLRHQQQSAFAFCLLLPAVATSYVP